MAAAPIKWEKLVGYTDEIKSAVEMATDCMGLKFSTYARLALIEKLVKDGFLAHPAIKYQNGNSEIKAAQ
jgi:hypothetical protein